MKKRILIYFIFSILLIFFVSVFCILKNSSIFIEDFNLKTFVTEIENNKMIILKNRHIKNNKIYGQNYSVPLGIYIYYNPGASNPKYIIWTHNRIFTTNNKKLFWKKLNGNIPTKDSEQKIHIINLCSEKNTNNDFLEELRKQNNFKEKEIDFYSSDGHENEIGYFSYIKYDSFVTFEKFDLCTCGSDSWIEFKDENKFINKLKTNWFYY